MLKTVTKYAVLGAVALTISMPLTARATTISVDFSRITSNNAENVASQFGLDIHDQAMALSNFALSIGGTQVLFAFTNAVGIPSNIAEIYIDDGTIVSLDSVVNSLGGFTSFSAAPPLNPGNLPAGNTVSPAFVATLAFSADTTPGPPTNGINTASDILGIVYSTTGGISGIESALGDGSLRVGLHVRSIGARGGSDSFVNNPPGVVPPEQIPEPGILALLGTGLLGMTLLGRRRRETI